jgi:hypothetical protein
MRQNREDDEYAADEQARDSQRRVEAFHNDEHVRERDRLAMHRFRAHQAQLAAVAATTALAQQRAIARPAIAFMQQSANKRREIDSMCTTDMY